MSQNTGIQIPKAGILAEFLSSTSLQHWVLWIQSVIILLTNFFLEMYGFAALWRTGFNYNCQTLGYLCLSVSGVYFLSAPSIIMSCSFLLTPSFPFSLSFPLWDTVKAAQRGLAEEGCGFHKALGSINVSQSTLSTWVNIIPAMLWWHPQNTRLIIKFKKLLYKLCTKTSDFLIFTYNSYFLKMSGHKYSVLGKGLETALMSWSHTLL